jgi:hypothetical protein
LIFNRIWRSILKRLAHLHFSLGYTKVFTPVQTGIFINRHQYTNLHEWHESSPEFHSYIRLPTAGRHAFVN